MDEDDSQIDYSHVLPRGEPILSTYRIRGEGIVRMGRLDVEATEGERGGFALRSFAKPLDFYLRRGHLSKEQHRAGIRYFKLWNYSILRARYVRMNYGDIGGAFDPVDHALAPRQYLDAQAAIEGEAARSAVFDVCCNDQAAGKRGRMHALRSGLDDLVRHFRIDN